MRVYLPAGGLVESEKRDLNRIRLRQWLRDRKDATTDYTDWDRRLGYDCGMMRDLRSFGRSWKMGFEPQRTRREEDAKGRN